MTKIKIVTDSSVTIEPELVKQLDITVVPLSVMIDNVVYSDADLKEEGKFLQLMQESKNLPKTSQPPVGVFAEVFEELSKDGSQILAIHMSHALSGTVEAARQGASLSTADVTVIDSSFTDQALKFQVVEAAKLAQEGKDMEEILTRVEAVKNNTELYIGVSTLENLVKGGRIGRVTGLLSSWAIPALNSPSIANLACSTSSARVWRKSSLVRAKACFWASRSSAKVAFSTCSSSARIKRRVSEPIASAVKAEPIDGSLEITICNCSVVSRTKVVLTVVTALKNAFSPRASDTRPIIGPDEAK